MQRFRVCHDFDGNNERENYAIDAEPSKVPTVVLGITQNMGPIDDPRQRAPFTRGAS